MARGSAGPAGEAGGGETVAGGQVGGRGLLMSSATPSSIGVQFVIDHIGFALTALLASAGGGAAVAFGLFRTLGDRWLSARFERSLQAHKHAQQRELEHLRFQISALLDRTTKVHQREFDVLPEAWILLVEARTQVMLYVSSFRELPNFMFASREAIEAVVNESPLHDFQKKDVLKSDDPQTTYRKYLSLIEEHRCRTACFECSNYLRKNGIFIQADLQALFDEISDLLWDAFFERSQNNQLDLHPPDQEKHKLFEQKVPNLIRTLESTLRGRLWSSDQRSTDVG